jgi:hypothetical protein
MPILGNSVCVIRSSKVTQLRSNADSSSDQGHCFGYEIAIILSI